LRIRSARLVQSGKRERGTQLVGRGSLRPRGLDGLSERRLRGDDIDGVLAQQQFAAPALDFRREPFLPGALDFGELFVEDRERLAELPFARLRFR